MLQDFVCENSFDTLFFLDQDEDDEKE